MDYHIEFDHHFYSIPHTLVHDRDKSRFEARATAMTVEVYCDGARVAAHARSYKRGWHTTVPEHMPKAHREHHEWSPSRLISWAGKSGEHTRALVEAILAERPHPEQGYRSCLGILRLGKRYGEERLEAACERAVAVRARSYRNVESMLKNGLDRLPPVADVPSVQLGTHENIRGSGYYH